MFVMFGMHCTNQLQMKLYVHKMEMKYGNKFAN